MTNTTNFYLQQEEPNQSCFLAMREIVLSMDAEIEESINYGSPCFIYRGRVFCYLWKDKKLNQPYFLLAEGKLLHHPLLETGDRKRMKVLRVRATEDLPIDAINTILTQALDLYKNGTLKTK